MKEISEKAKEAQRAYLREWRRKNPEKVQENNRRYWERKAQQMAALEYTLRLLEKQKKLPCIYTGRKCLINYDRLLEMLGGLGA